MYVKFLLLVYKKKCYKKRRRNKGIKSEANETKCVLCPLELCEFTKLNTSHMLSMYCLCFVFLKVKHFQDHWQVVFIESLKSREHTTSHTNLKYMYTKINTMKGL